MVLSTYHIEIHHVDTEISQYEKFHARARKSPANRRDTEVTSQC